MWIEIYLNRRCEMTEKRFELTKADPSISQWRIYDYHNENAYCINADEHTLQCIVDVLNTQEAIINNLEKVKEEADNLLLQIYKQLKLHYMPNAEEQVNKIIDELIGDNDHDDDI